MFDVSPNQLRNDEVDYSKKPWLCKVQLCAWFSLSSRRVLHTLDQTRHDVKIMKKAIKTITTKFEDAKKTTSNLMKQLTTKATALEKLKSRVTVGTDLEAHMKLYMTESEDEEEEELLLQEEYDDYDKEFDKMREAKLKNRQAVAKEELIQAQKHVEECRQNLEYARQQVRGQWYREVSTN